MNKQHKLSTSPPGLPGQVSASSQAEGAFSSLPIPQPIKEPDQSHLPSALTFFLTRNQRTQILRALKALNQNRTAALIKALNIQSDIR